MVMSVKAATMLVKGARPDYTNRWNVEVLEDGVWFCRGEHEKSEDCQWEKLNVNDDSPPIG